MSQQASYTPPVTTTVPEQASYYSPMTRPESASSYVPPTVAVDQPRAPVYTGLQAGLSSVDYGQVQQASYTPPARRLEAASSYVPPTAYGLPPAMPSLV